MTLHLDAADQAAAEPLLATGLFAGIAIDPTIPQRASSWSHASAGSTAGPEKPRKCPSGLGGQARPRLVDCDPRPRELGRYVVVEVVTDRAGSDGCAALSARGVPTLLTAVYAHARALVSAGAISIAPYPGKLPYAGRDRLRKVAAMREALAATGSTTKALLAGIRDLGSRLSMAYRAVSLFTVASAMAEQFFIDALTAEAVRTLNRAVTAPST